jgi:hypothetical protein
MSDVDDDPTGAGEPEDPEARAVLVRRNDALEVASQLICRRRWICGGA